MTADIVAAIQAHIQAHLSRFPQPMFAIVTACDPKAGMVKVTIQPDGIETTWIADSPVQLAGAVVHAPSKLQTPVIVAPIGGGHDAFAIVARVFDSISPPPNTAATGQPLQPGEFGVVLEDGTELVMTAGKIAMKAKTVSVDGDLTCTGAITAQGDVKAGSISLQQHTHGGVQSGAAYTKPPQ